MRHVMATLLVVLPLAGPPVLAWGTDSDNDGVRDKKDKCAGTPISAKIAKDGCPVDSDLDGVPTGIDECSKTPAGWPVDERGCPRDTDRDGVVDAKDTCAATPEGARADAVGCPSDSDGDRVLDGIDRCGYTSAGYTVEMHGCPTDSDHDGVNDALDRCANSGPRETVDPEGCRVKAAPVLEPGMGKILLQGVTFEKNKIELTPESEPVLMNAATSLKEWPDDRMEIGVRTDPAGSASKNRELSQRRAEYVKNYLVALGVEESRLQPKGYGEKESTGERTVELSRLP